MDTRGMPRTVVGGLALAESPRWCARRGAIYLIDIVGREVLRYRPGAAGGVGPDADAPPALERRALPEEPGFVIPFAPPAGADALGLARAEAAEPLLVGLPDGLYRLEFSTGRLERLVAVEADRPELRLNDGACDASGRVWFGSMNRDGGPAAGSLYSFDGVELRRHDGPVECWNGIGWSPDGATMYATDTVAGEIRAYPVGPAAALGEPRIVARPAGDGGGLPDGLAVDRDGGLWSALWDGSRLVRFVDGAPAGSVPAPGSRPTSLAFLPGGAVAVTTAEDGAGPGGLHIAAPGWMVPAGPAVTPEFSPRGAARPARV